MTLGETQSRGKIAIHRIVVDVDLDLTHARGSAAVLLFQGFGFLRLRLYVGVDLTLVGMLVSQRRMNLRE